MSLAPLRFCAAPGCSARVPHGRCERHRAAARPARQSSHAAGYTKRWHRFRSVTFPALLLDQGIVPACGARLHGGPSPDSECARLGVVNFERLEAHHEPPLQDWERSDPTRVCDPDRIVLLCSRDHGRRTRRDATGGR